MKLSELFSAERVFLGVAPADKEQLLHQVVKYFDDQDLIKNFDQALRDVIERERVMSTGIGNGVAIPHAYTDGVEELVAGFFRTDDEVDFEAVDGRGVDLFFIILGPKASRRSHIKVLARISRLLNHADFRTSLRQAESKEAVLEVFKRVGDR